MNKKDYRLIDLFRDNRINTKARRDSQHGLEGGNGGRSAWLYHGEYEKGKMSLGRHELASFFKMVGLNLSQQEVYFQTTC